MTRTSPSKRLFVTLTLGALFTIAGTSLGTGCKNTGVGDPCTPEQEYDPTFSGFDEQEVNVESKSFQCQTRVCLANHFRGRVSCPYGQDVDGKDPDGKEPGCKVPGADTAITGPVDAMGNPVDQKNKKKVQAQCTDRTSDKAVYCSCRCANIDGRTDDGAQYCTCPDNFSCVQLVSSIGQGDVGLTGRYCIKNGTEYDRASACSVQCKPGVKGQTCP